MRTNSFVKLLICSLLSVALFSCKPENKSAKLMIDQTEISFSEDGGFGRVTYTLLNSEEEIEVINLPQWIGNVTTAIKGEVSFVVAFNPGAERSVELSLKAGESEGTVTIKQDAFRPYPTRDFLLYKKFVATYAEFFPDETIMARFIDHGKEGQYYDTDNSGKCITMTAREWGEQQAGYYNELYPDQEPVSMEDFMGFDYTPTNPSRYYLTYMTINGNGRVEAWSGVEATGGGVLVMQFCADSFDYDENTGIMTFESLHNSLYTCECKVQLERQTNGQITYEVIQFKNGEYEASIGLGDMFIYNLQFACWKEEDVKWQPCKKIVFHCDIEELVE